MPSREETIDAWQDVQSRAFQCFAFYMWRTRIGPQWKGGRDIPAVLTEDATVESTLMSVRDLDSFFRLRRRQPDDILADDYAGFQSPGAFLSQPEVASINKKLAHLTYVAVRERRQMGVGHKPRMWNSADLVTRAMDRMVPFMMFLASTYFASEPVLAGQVRRAIDLLRSYVKGMNSFAQSENLDIPT
jgi:hypothetical protein